MPPPGPSKSVSRGVTLATASLSSTLSTHHGGVDGRLMDVGGRGCSVPWWRCIKALAYLAYSGCVLLVIIFGTEPFM